MRRINDSVDLEPFIYMGGSLADSQVSFGSLEIMARLVA